MQPFIMTAGGPLNSTWTPVYLLYREAFQYLRLGYGTAMGIVLTSVILVVTIVQRRIVEREVAY
ncbi:MAG: sugar ABC transporter permease [Chloroflexi bacterium]|nr:sugar ABC transporter permease [Chloroflexota bacterium]